MLSRPIPVYPIFLKYLVPVQRHTVLSYLVTNVNFRPGEG